MTRKKQKGTKSHEKDKILFDGSKPAKNRENEVNIPNIEEITPIPEDNQPETKEKQQETPQNSLNSTSLTIYQTAIDKILLDSTLPDHIEPIQDKRSKYTPQMALKILIEIATNGNDTIYQICKNNGIESTTLSLWSLYSDDLYSSLHRAKEMRQDARVDSIEAGEHSLQAIVGNPAIDVREKHVQIQYHRVTTMSKQWLAARLNKRYQEKTQQDTTVTIDHADLRAQAWEQVHNPPKEIPHTVVDNDTQVSNNPTE